VASPRGVALTNANVLSAITVTARQSVLFDQCPTPPRPAPGKPVRAQAEAAVRAIPGVTVAMIALTAERRPGAAASPPAAPARPGGAARLGRIGRRKVRRRRCRKQSEIPGIAR